LTHKVPCQLCFGSYTSNDTSINVGYTKLYLSWLCLHGLFYSSIGIRTSGALQVFVPAVLNPHGRNTFSSLQYFPRLDAHCLANVRSLYICHICNFCSIDVECMLIITMSSRIRVKPRLFSLHGEYPETIYHINQSINQNAFI